MSQSPNSPPPADSPAKRLGIVRGLIHAVRKALPKDSLRARMAKGAFWTVAGSAISMVLGAVANVVTGRILRLEGFGELGMIQSTIGMVGVFAGMGLGMTGMKHLAEFRKTDPQRAARIVWLSAWAASISGVVMAILAAVLAPALADYTMKAPQLVPELRLACLLLVFNTISSAQNGALSGLEAFRAIAVVSTIRGMLTFPLIIAGTYFWGLRGAILASSAAAAFNCLLNTLALRRVCRREGIPTFARGVRQELPILWKFSLPAFISGILFTPVDWLLKSMLFRSPGGAGEMALFNAANYWYNLVLYLPGLLSGVTLPLLASLWAEKRWPQYRRMLVVNSALLTVAAAVVAVPVAVASKWIMLAYGRDFAGGMPVLLVMCALSVLYSANIVVGQAIWASGSSIAGMVLAAVRAAVLIGSFLLMRPWGAVGLAWAYLISYIAMTAYQTPLAVLSYKRGTRSAAAVPCKMPTAPSP